MASWITDNIHNQSSGADQSRLPHSDLTSEKSGLTQYEEIVEPDVLEEEVVNSTSLFDVTQYLETQDVSTIMERSYQVDSFAWATGDVAETSKGVYRFPHLLWTQPWIQSIMSGYKYFRCKGIEISFRIQSTSMHQGALQVSHVFNESPTESDSFRASFARRRNNRPLLFSAMPGNSQILRLPWNNPVQWCRISDVGSDAFNIGVVDVDVLVPLRSVSSTILDCKVTVFASFIEPELSGPSVFVPLGKKNNDKGAAKESVEKSTSGISEFVNTVTSSVESVVGLAGTLAPLAALVLDKPSSVVAVTPSRFAFGDGQLTTEGMSTETCLGASQTSMLTQQDGSMGVGVPNPSLTSVLQTPGFRRSWEFSNSNTQEAIDIEPSDYALVSGSTTKAAPTFLAYFTLPFAYWRGSITFQVFFFCSTFTSGRFRFTWTPDTNGVVSITGQEGNIMSKVVEVRGDTHTTITIPYAKPELWSKVYKPGDTFHAHEHSNGYLQVDRISVSSVAADPIINAVVYQHAGPDFQVGRYCPHLFDTSTLPGGTKRQFVSMGDGEAPSAAVWEYSTVHDPIYTSTGLNVSGYAQAESYDDICSLMKRMHETLDSNSPGFGTAFPPPASFWLDGSRDPVVLILNSFRYFRGGIRALYIRKSSGDADDMGTISFWDDEQVTITDNLGTYGGSIPLKVPWFSQFPFVKTNLGSTGPIHIGHDTGNFLLKWCFADDVGISGLFSPPLLETIVNP